MEKPTTLRHAFNAQSLSAAELERLPAYRFEIATGLTGIAGHYNYPDGMRAKQFEDFFFWSNNGETPGFLARTKLPEKDVDVRSLGGIDRAVLNSSPGFRHVMLQVWSEMVRLNPQLADVKVDRGNPNSVYDALLGTASGFNVDDINFYLDSRWVNNQHPALVTAAGTRAVENLCGVMPEWVPSPETFDKIGAQLGHPNLSQSLLVRPSAPPPIPPLKVSP